jgi:outer membrane protein OmpA-like peptidoglycan-associated protein
LEVVSFGEERPAAEGDDEAARSQNRRAEFEITAGGDFSQPSSQSRTNP